MHNPYALFVVVPRFILRRKRDLSSSTGCWDGPVQTKDAVCIGSSSPRPATALGEKTCGRIPQDWTGNSYVNIIKLDREVPCNE